MVCLGQRDGLVVTSSMAVAPERTAAKPLHNFNLPCLKWGNQRHLRCVQVNSDVGGGTDRRSAGMRFETLLSDRRRVPESEMRKRQRFFSKSGRIEDEKEDDDGEGGIAAVREKLMCDLKKAADKMKDAIFRKETAAAAEDKHDGANTDEDDEDDDDVATVEAEGEQSLSAAAAAAAALEVRPWNLRTRRAACKAPAKRLRIEDRKVNCSPLRTKVNNGNGNAARSPRPVRGIALEKKERVKFSVALARKEIEEDFMDLLGHRPPRRPKKRPRIVQRQLDTLFPGLLLREVTTETYKVPELPENGRR